MPTTQPVLSIADQITTRLRGELMAGRFKPGESLREEQIAERFGVSRHPVRKVFQQLAHEGLLVARRNCGVTVALPPNDAVRGLLMPMRVQIETFALRTCFDCLGESELDEWLGRLGPFRLACEEGDHAAVFDRDMDFHRTLLLKAGLSDLLSLWTQIIGKTTSFYEHERIDKDDLLIIYEVHVALIEMFRGRDVDACVVALSEHILNGEFNQRIHRRWHAAKTAPHHAGRNQSENHS